MLQSKIIEIVDIYSEMIETSYRKDISRGNYEINFTNNKLCVSEQSGSYAHSGAGADYSFEEFLTKKKGQSFIKSNFDKNLLQSIIKEVERRMKYPQFYLPI